MTTTRTTDPEPEAPDHTQRKAILITVVVLLAVAGAAFSAHTVLAHPAPSAFSKCVNAKNPDGSINFVNVDGSCTTQDGITSFPPKASLTPAQRCTAGGGFQSIDGKCYAPTDPNQPLQWRPPRTARARPNSIGSLHGPRESQTQGSSVTIHKSLAITTLAVASLAFAACGGTATHTAATAPVPATPFTRDLAALQTDLTNIRTDIGNRNLGALVIDGQALTADTDHTRMVDLPASMSTTTRNHFKHALIWYGEAGASLVSGDTTTAKAYIAQVTPEYQAAQAAM
jgi:hypothetical protein